MGKNFCGAARGDAPRLSGGPWEGGLPRSGFSEVLYEASVEVGKSKEGPYVGNVSWCLPLLDCLHLSLIHLEPVSVDMHSKPVGFWYMELAFSCSAEQAVFLELG